MGSKFAFSKVLISDDKIDKIVAGKYIEYVDDKHHRFTINDIITSGEFIPYNKDYVSFRYSKSTMWFKISILNKGTSDKYLEIDQPLIGNIEFYKVINNKIIYSKKNIGDLFPHSNREIDHRNFIFKIQTSKNPITCIFKISSESRKKFNIILWSKTAFKINDFKRNYDHFNLYNTNDTVLLHIFFSIIFSLEI